MTLKEATSSITKFFFLDSKPLKRKSLFHSRLDGVAVGISTTLALFAEVTSVEDDDELEDDVDDGTVSGAFGSSHLDSPVNLLNQNSLPYFLLMCFSHGDAGSATGIVPGVQVGADAESLVAAEEVEALSADVNSLMSTTFKSVASPVQLMSAMQASRSHPAGQHACTRCHRVTDREQQHLGISWAPAALGRCLLFY